MALRLGGGFRAKGTLSAWTVSSDVPSGEVFFQMKHSPSDKRLTHLFLKQSLATLTMCSETCAHSGLPSNTTCTCDPTLSTFQSVTIETFCLVLCSLAHTNN